MCSDHGSVYEGPLSAELIQTDEKRVCNVTENRRRKHFNVDENNTASSDEKEQNHRLVDAAPHPNAHR